MLNHLYIIMLALTLCYGHNSKRVVPSNLPITKNDSIAKIDSIFNVLKTDSLARVDSIGHDKLQKDSASKADSIRLAADDIHFDTVTLQRKTDSLFSIVETDSIELCKQDSAIFKGQSVLKLKGGMYFEVRMDCLEFMLANNMVPIESATKYLTFLKKYCMDRQHLFYSMICLIEDENKTLCALYYKKSKDELSKVQTELYKLQTALP